MKKTLLLSIVSLGIAAAANAAPITWGSAVSVDINDPTQISNVGVAHASATFTSAPLTINGISFAAPSGYTTGASATVNFTDPNITVQNLVIGESGIGVAGPGTTDYSKLVGSGIFQINNGITESWRVSSLTLGQQYQVQLWTAYNGDYPTRFASDVFFANASPFLANSPQPQFVIGTFIADTATQDIYIEGNANGYSVFGPISVAAVPEPSTWALACVAGLGLIAFRKSRRAAAAV